MNNITKTINSLSKKDKEKFDYDKLIMDSLKSFFKPFCPELQLSNSPLNITNFKIPESQHTLA